ncbi:MAG: putative manganese-dependent inorganic diphosphatase, partial [Erysipelotrichaceae bacterium]|nr:putative manganese-dependent inorganic diphosphatase [Erysipelotrichaceae bacterium]
ITGHKNPDTDTIVSTLAYADLKKRLGYNVTPIRIGNINSETAFILRKFKMTPPPLFYDIKTRVCDIDFDYAFRVNPDAMIKEAWEIMRANDKKVIAVVDKQDHLIGMATISNITSGILSSTLKNYDLIKRIPLENITASLNGELLVNPRHYHPNGIINITTSKLLEQESLSYKDEIVITSNRPSSHLHAIETKAALVVACQTKEVTPEVILTATKHNCAIITTPYDIYTTSLSICHAIPIADIMSVNLVTFNYYDYLDDVKAIIPKSRFRSYPVIDNENVLKGFISRYHLWGHEKRRLILVDHNETNQSIDGIEQAEVIEIIDHHRVGDVTTDIPIRFRNEIVGSCATIISKMYKEYDLEPDKDMAGILCGAIISDTMNFNSPTSTVDDRKIAASLAKIANIDLDDYAQEIFTASTSLAGKGISEIVHNDLKEFNMQSFKVVIGQINIVDSESIIDIKDQISEFLDDLCMTSHYDLALMIFTDIYKKGSYFIWTGKDKCLLDLAFENLTIDENGLYYVANLMSRKQQVVPALARAISIYHNK